MTDILYKSEAYSIQGAIFEIYREIGSGFLEAVYQECLAKEIAPEHQAQVFNYLRASGLQLGLLVNFGHCPKATVQRIAL